MGWGSGFDRYTSRFYPSLSLTTVPDSLSLSAMVVSGGSGSGDSGALPLLLHVS